jgi:transposase-like protein
MSKASIPAWRLEVERVKIKGQLRYLWKAVDEAGELLDFYATEERDEAAARQFFEQALKDPWTRPEIRSGVSTRRRKSSVRR